VTIKNAVEGWVRSKPVLAMVAVAAVGLVVGGIVGLGAGYKVEKNRVRDDVQRLQRQLKDAGATATSEKVVQRVGEIKAVSGATLTVKTRLQGDQDVETTSATFRKTVEGTVDDIAVGKKVLVATGAREVIILDEGTEIGHAVTAVTDEGFTVALDKGRSADVETSNVDKVYTLTTAESSDAKVDTGVVIAGKRVGSEGFQATEVIVLPTDSAFNG
jgi:hypothetical protein